MKNFQVGFIFILLVSSCSGQDGNILSPKEFKTKMSQTSVTLLDVRTVDEFKAGHLEKAININVNSTQFELECAKLDKSKLILVYCLSGKRSQRAAEALWKKGFKVQVLDGGIEAWHEKQMPVVKW